ncbi:MAG: helix-turn-helix domain-containing protein [Euryarchaeota archaeon]|nr:helix-turn-helix domain-containing protein [Euryarchaeota archaeon]
MNRIDRMVSRMIDFALERPGLAPSRILIVSLSKRTLEKVLTPSRMDLIRMIREKRPKSVGELAKLVKRPVESVSRDLRFLESYGLLSLVQVGKIKKPEIEKDVLMIPLTA